MSNEALMNAYDECLKRLRKGVPLEVCIQDYPQHASHLRFLLMTSEVLEQHLAPQYSNIHSIQNRVRWRVMRETLQASPRSGSWRRIGLVAVIFILLFSLGGLIYSSGQSLPGEPLYPLKNQVDDVRVSLGQDPGQIEMAQIEDIQQALSKGLVASVEFKGSVEVIQINNDNNEWQITGLLVIVNSKTVVTGEYGLGSVVSVKGYITPYHELIATRIDVINNQTYQTLTPTPILTSTATMTMTVTNTPTIEINSTATTTRDPTGTETVEQSESVFTSCTLESLSTTLINIRAGDSTVYAVIGQLFPDDPHIVIAKNDDSETWYAIYLDNGSLGWVFGELAELNGNCDHIPILPSPIISSTSSGNGGDKSGNSNSANNSGGSSEDKDNDSEDHDSDDDRDDHSDEDGEEEDRSGSNSGSGSKES